MRGCLNHEYGMERKIKMYCYFAYGLPIISELRLPELMLQERQEETMDNAVTINIGDVNPEGISQPSTKGLFYQVTEQQLWLHVPSIGYFLITDGHLITISPAAGIDEDSLREYIFSFALGVILLQRRLFVLQGSAIKMGEHCFSIAGHSGAGKSTLTAAFLKRGYAILADDFTAIHQQGHVLPGLPVLKIWFDAAKILEIESASLKKIRPRIQKFIIPLGAQFCDKPLPVKMIYILDDAQQNEYTYNPILGVKKIPCLQNFMYRKSSLMGLDNEKHLHMCSIKIANQVAMTRITRPHDEFKLEECVDFIEKDLTERGFFHG